MKKRGNKGKRERKGGRRKQGKEKWNEGKKRKCLEEITGENGKGKEGDDNWREEMKG
jgi:hypothetical protein